MTSRRGTTIMEMLVAIFLLGILLGAVLFLYVTGTRAVIQGDVRTDVLRDLQVAASDMTREIETSCYAGLSIEPELVCVLSSRPADGSPPTLGPNGDVVWQKYVVFWRDPATRELHRRDVTIPPTTAGQTIDVILGQPASSYTSPPDGRRIGEDMVEFLAEVPPGTQRVKAKLTCEKMFRGKPNRQSLEYEVGLKN